MNMLKKFIPTIWIVLLAIVFFATPTLAIDPIETPEMFCERNPEAAACQADTPNPFYGDDGVITTATQIVGTIVGVASVIMIIVGGFKYISSAGDPNSTKSAKDTILYALIGLVVATLAHVIASFVMGGL